MKFNEKMLLLYAVTDQAWVGKQTLLEQVEDALKGGATIIQLREKKLDEDSFVEEAIQVRALCHKYNVPLIINDNVEVALKSGADGVHVGIEDAPVAEILCSEADATDQKQRCGIIVHTKADNNVFSHGLLVIRTALVFVGEGNTAPTPI